MTRRGSMVDIARKASPYKLLESATVGWSKVEHTSPLSFLDSSLHRLPTRCGANDLEKGPSLRVVRISIRLVFLSMLYTSKTQEGDFAAAESATKGLN